MPRPQGSKNKNPGKPRFRGNDVFSHALRDAEKALDAKTKERDAANIALKRLNIEIPALEGTVRALKYQLRPDISPAPAQSAPAATGALDVAREVPEGAGSIPVAQGPPAPAETPDLNTLPGMAEEFV